MKVAFNFVRAKYVLEHLDDEPIIDMRTKTEFDEGHIPHARDIDYFELKAMPNTADFLARKMRDYGISPDEDVIIYCKGGRRARAAAELLDNEGYHNLHVYAESWLNWIDDPSHPIEK